MAPRRVWLASLVTLAALTPTVFGQSPAEVSLPATVEFNRDIRPILSDKCYTCHGPSKQMSSLRFDQEESAKKDRGSGNFAIVPGNPAKSVMLDRITTTDTKKRMPFGADALSARETGLIRRWIEQGATWQQHWSFIPPKQPTPNMNVAGARNPIDTFVFERLQREGLKPSAPADRATLLRRVSFDLTGLPPTLAEINAFVNDKAPNAYEKVVDRLLQSPRYGERMAFTWLEAARYADTNGYQHDLERHMWRWRDWVISAFNKNMPFDQFTIEQLAGDMLPNPTLDQRIATAFNRNHRGNSEGGIVPEEYHVEYVLDRAETTGTVFLGLTVGCARCHDHKYDPIKQKDLYQLFAYFNNIPEIGKARRTGNSPPVVKAPTTAQQTQLDQLDQQLSAATNKFNSLAARMNRSQKDWEKTLNKSASTQWGPTRGLVAHYMLDGDLTAPLSQAQDGKTTSLKFQEGDPAFAEGRIGRAAAFDGKRYIDAGDVAGFKSHDYYDDKYTMAAWIYPTAGTGAIVTKAADQTEPGGHGLNLKDGKIEFNMVDDWLDSGIRLESENLVSLNQWHHVAITYDGSRWASGVKLYVDGTEWRYKTLLDDLNNRGQLRQAPFRIGAGGGPQNRFKGSIDEVRVYTRALETKEIAALASPLSLGEIATSPEYSRSVGDAEKLSGYFLENTAPADIRDANKQLIDARVKREAFYESIPTVMVMEEMPTPRETHVLIRGLYDRPGDKVTPTLPGFLTSATNFPPNRLGLARWLVDPSNPLMSRVTVNRFWQMYFGTGIVRTVEDFGSQGEPPSHP